MSFYVCVLQIIDLIEEIGRSTILFGDFNIPFLVIDAIVRRKISKDVDDLNDTQPLFSN